ncbi:hypothetical protein GCM10023310_70200 [Paenibacillus vulneris]
MVKEWDVLKTKFCTPMDVTCTSHKRVWWICESDHSVYEPVRLRVKNKGCSKCATIKRQEMLAQKAIKRNVDLPLTETFQDLKNHPKKQLRFFFGAEAIYSAILIEDFMEMSGGCSEVRVYNCLKRVGVNSLEDLLNLSYEELVRVRNMGDGSHRKLYSMLQNFFSNELYKEKH